MVPDIIRNYFIRKNDSRIIAMLNRCQTWSRRCALFQSNGS